MALKGTLSKVATPKKNILWDSEGYPVRVGDEVNLVSARQGDFRTATVTEVTATYCDVQAISGAKPVRIPAYEIQNQHDRLISKTAKKEGREKSPSAKITEPPRGELRTSISNQSSRGSVKPRRLD